MNDTDLMEMRREVERLKAAVEELGRRIEDQADAEAMPLRVEAGNGIEVQESGGAYRVSAAETEKTTTDPACLAVVVSGDGAAGYQVALFANGLDQARTGTGTLFFPETAAYSGQDLQPGDVLVAHSALVKLVEGLVP